MEPLTPIYAGDKLLPLHEQLVALVRGLAEEDWSRPTVARAWRVRDVVAHLVDGSMRTIASQRDAYRPRQGRAPATYRELVDYINAANRAWIEASERFSPALLIDLLERYGPIEAPLLAGLPPHEPSRVAVAWAGESESHNWMHVGREYTERWHHQMQIRDAIKQSRPAAVTDLLQRDWCYPVLDLSMRALPHGYRSHSAQDGVSVLIRVAAPTAPTPWSAEWSLRYDTGVWTVWRGYAPKASTTVSTDADTLWRLFYNALRVEDARHRIAIEGDESLAEPLFSTRSVMV